MLHSHNLYKDFGVTRSNLSYCIQNIWNPKDFKDCLDKSYLLIWESDYLLSQVSSGAISHQGVDYTVIYHKVSRGEILSNTKLAKEFEELCPKYKLSFRKPIAQSNLPAYVLVAKYFDAESYLSPIDVFQNHASI